MDAGYIPVKWSTGNEQRPLNPCQEDRMGKKEKEVKTNAMRILEKEKIAYTSHTYECTEFTDGAQIADTLGLPHEKVYKTLVTVGKSKEHYVFVLAIDDELDFKKSAKVAGEKSLEMLPLKELTALTGYVRGGCTSIGMKKHFPTFFQESITELETVLVSGGKLGLQLELKPADLIRAAGGKTADFIAER